MVSFWAILAAVTVVLVAPLVLGTYVVVQGASRRAVLAWLAAIAGLLLATLGAGAVMIINTL